MVCAKRLFDATDAHLLAPVTKHVSHRDIRPSVFLGWQTCVTLVKKISVSSFDCISAVGVHRFHQRRKDSESEDDRSAHFTVGKQNSRTDLPHPVSRRARSHLRSPQTTAAFHRHRHRHRDHQYLRTKTKTFNQRKERTISTQHKRAISKSSSDFDSARNKSERPQRKHSARTSKSPISMFLSSFERKQL